MRLLIAATATAATSTDVMHLLLLLLLPLVILEIEYCTALVTCRGLTDPTGACVQPVCACV
jgi:hypothetical protein